jgi:catalase
VDNSSDLLASNNLVSINAARMNDFYKETTRERIFHGNGTGFGGTFKVTGDITKYTKAKIFSELGKETEVVVRLSSTTSQHGTSEMFRDTRGFSVRFKGEDGPFDIVGLNVPIQYVVDRENVLPLHNGLQKNYFSGLYDETIKWMFFSKTPESLHKITMVWSDRGIPKTWRNMNGYGCNTFSFINKDKERFWVKFHFKTMQGHEFFTDEEAALMSQKEPNYHTYDMYEAISKKDFPKWKLCVQVMPEDECTKLDFNPFRMNNVWPHDQFPLIEVGVMELNIDSYHQLVTIERMAWSPSNIPDGIGFSPDGALLDRATAYPLLQRSRVGYDVNVLSKHAKSEINKFLPTELFYKCEHKETDDHFNQVRKLWNIFSDEEKNRLYKNLASTLMKVKPDVVMNQLHLFHLIDPRYAEGVHDALKNKGFKN